MDKFLNKNIFQELISNLYRVPFLDIAAIYMLILFAFVCILIFIPTISSWKIKANILRLTKTIHLLSIIWIVISLFMMKALKYKLPESLNFVFGLKFAVVLILAIVILVYVALALDLIFDDIQPYKISEYKFFLVGTFLITYLNYVFIFMAAKKSVILLILGSIILLYANKFWQNGLNDTNIEYSEIQKIDNDFKQLIASKKSLNANFNSLINLMKSIANDNRIIDVDMSTIDDIKNPYNNILYHEEYYLSHVEILNKIKKSEHPVNQKLDKMRNFYLNNLQGHFYCSKAGFKKLISKQFQLCDSLENQKLSQGLDEKFVDEYKKQIEAEKKKLRDLIVLLDESKVEDYPEMNEFFKKELNNSLLRVYYGCKL